MGSKMFRGLGGTPGRYVEQAPRAIALSPQVDTRHLQISSTTAHALSEPVLRKNVIALDATFMENLKSWSEESAGDRQNMTSAVVRVMLRGSHCGDCNAHVRREMSKGSLLLYKLSRLEE